MKRYNSLLAAIAIALGLTVPASAATITDGGSVLDEPAWFSQGYGNDGYILANALPPTGNAISDNISTNGSGADIEYALSFNNYEAPGGDGIPIENSTGTATNLQLGVWRRNAIGPGTFVTVISFTMSSTPSALTVGVLVGPAGSADNDSDPIDYPTAIRLSDDGGTTYVQQTVTKPASPPYQADWYFFNVTGITPGTVLTVIADGQSNVSGNKNVPISGVVFAQPSDTTGPALVSLSPDDDASAVATAGDLVLTFNEVVAAGSGSIFLRRTSSGSAVATFDVNSDVTFQGGQATMSYAGLEILADYHVEVAAGAIEDASGNSFAGISDETAWNFTTAASVTNVTDWVTRGYGETAYIFFDENTAATSANFSVSGGGGDIEYTDLSAIKKNAESGNIPIQNEAGTATDLNVGRWLDGGLDGGVFADLISFAMKNTPSELRIGVLVGAGGGANSPYAPSSIRLTDGDAYTNTINVIERGAIKRPDWYFFDVTGITGTTELTVLATRGLGFKWNPINGVVFAPIPAAPAPPPPAGTVFYFR